MSLTRETRTSSTVVEMRGGDTSARRRHDELVVDEEVEDPADQFTVHDDAADAHRQVLEMSATIEILTRDFENLQRELLDAYKKLQEYSDQDPRLHSNRQGSVSPSKVGTSATGGIVSNAMAKLRSGNYGDCGCGHEQDVHELEQIISVKDTALTEALHERNDYKLRLERAESMIRDLQYSGNGSGSNHHDGGRVSSSRGGRGAGGLHIQTSSRTASFTGGSIPYGMTSTSPVHVTMFSPTSSSGTSASSATASSRDVPKHERFDHESSYQSKEDDELFWRRQYRDAVRMRKHHGGQPAGTTSSLHGSNGGGGLGGGGCLGGGVGTHPRPSLKIFSTPNSHRQKGITDENVPFTRYIGISTRQNEIIKEQHRMLS